MVDLIDGKADGLGGRRNTHESIQVSYRDEGPITLESLHLIEIIKRKNAE